MAARIVSTLFLVSGVETDWDTKLAMQGLFDVFAANGLGQATFEIVTGEPTKLWIKHRDDVVVDPELIDTALRRGGDYRLLADGEADAAES